MDLTRACDILGVARDAPYRELRRAYRMQVRLWHPDRFANDPAGQQRAEELLKEINEAYRLLQEAAAWRAHSPPEERPDSHSETPVSEPPRKVYAPEDRRYAGSEAFALLRAFPTLPIITFFSAWQNVIFMLLVVCTASVSLQIHGTFFNGAGYLLRMLAVPFVFALICNFVYGGKRFLWGVYALVVLFAGVAVMLDSVRFRNDWREADSYRYYAPPDGVGGVNYGGGVPASQEQGGFQFPGRREPSGPVPPEAPEVTAPSTPLAPAAPLAPAVSPAVPAR